MAKAKTKSAPKRVQIKGADKADKKQVAAARAANKTEQPAVEAKMNTKAAASSPEAQPTPRQARDAAQALFDKADEDGQAALIAEATARKAIFG